MGLARVRILGAVMLLVLVLTSPAYAEDIYIANVAAGADDGTSCANAHARSWFGTAGNWDTPPTQTAGKISGGDTVHLCGTITNTAGSTILQIQNSGFAGNPITILFETDAKLSATIPAPNGLLFCSTTRTDIIIDGGTNGVIEATDNGATLGNQETGFGFNCSRATNITVRNLTVRNMYVREFGSDSFSNTAHGISFTGGTNITIHNNTVHDTICGISAAYNDTSPLSGVFIYGNTITRSKDGMQVGSTTDNATADDIQIYNNVIHSLGNWDGTWAPPPGDGHHHTDGIQIWANNAGAVMTNLVVHGNYIGGDNGEHTTAWIYTQAVNGGELSGSKIYNNVLTVSGTSFPGNGFITIGRSNNLVYNNTIIGTSTSGTGNIGIYFPTSGSTGNVAKNNIITTVKTGISMVSGTSDYNVLHNLGSGTNAMSYGGVAQTVATWQGAGRDANGLLSDPLVSREGIFGFLQSGSPAINAGTALGAPYNVDRRGTARPQGAAWDIGAYEVIPTTNSTTVSPGMATQNGVTVR
jgi:hypothetical protein